MKKIFTILLAMMMCLSLFACGAKQETAEELPSVEASDSIIDSESNADESDTADTAPTTSVTDEQDGDTVENSAIESEESNQPAETPAATTKPTDTEKAKEQTIVNEKNNPQDSFNNAASTGNDTVVDESDWDGGIAIDEDDPDAYEPSFYEIYGFNEGTAAHLQFLIDNGENPMEYGFTIPATDTKRNITYEELLSFLATGRSIIDDNYYDYEHEQGLY